MHPPSTCTSPRPGTSAPFDDTLAPDQQQREPVDPGTDIHRFDISDPERATYEMSGHVAGTVLTQYGMDEQGETLRVATQTWARFGWNDDSESHVVVLQPTRRSADRGWSSRRSRDG